MNLIFRLLTVVVTALLGRSLGFLEESRLRLRVWPTDLDINMHMTNARYFSVMDLGRMDMVVRSGIARAMMRHRWHPVLGASTIRFRRPLKPFQSYELVSRLLCWDERWFFIEQRIETPDGTAAVAVMQCAFIGRGVVPPAEVLAAVGQRVDSPPMPDFVSAWQPQTLPIERAA